MTRHEPLAVKAQTAAPRRAGRYRRSVEQAAGAERRRVMAKKPRGNEGIAWGILNPWGDVWTTNTFETEEAARAHVREFWARFPEQRDLTKFKPVRVKVHVSVATPTAQE